MPITYTNHKGITYYLCRGTTKTGKPRYTFAREPKGEPLEKIPDGWEIRESVNGVISLAKKRPQQILPEEVSTVEAAVQRHPKAHNYRVSVKPDRIEIYERVGADPDDLVSELEKIGLLAPRTTRVRAILERRVQYTPVMCFILEDEAQRIFAAERMCYRSSVDGWLNLYRYGRIDRLAQELIPTLGTEAFYELV